LYQHLRYALTQLRHDAEVKNEGRGQKRVLARVVHDKSVLAAHEDFAGVLIHGALAVADVGDVPAMLLQIIAREVKRILDDNDVVGVLILGITAQEDASER
jgi:hypothetical protein